MERLFCWTQAMTDGQWIFKWTRVFLLWFLVGMLIPANRAAPESSMPWLQRVRSPAAFRLVPKPGDVVQAYRHLVRVTRAVSCRTPRPRLVHVRACYPHLSGMAFPHSTLLHECSDATGCCPTDKLVCTALHEQLVTLHFHVHDWDGSRRVEALAFVNHTECTCGRRLAFFGDENALCPLAVGEDDDDATAEENFLR